MTHVEYSMLAKRLRTVKSFQSIRGTKGMNKCDPHPILLYNIDNAINNSNIYKIPWHAGKTLKTHACVYAHGFINVLVGALTPGLPCEHERLYLERGKHADACA